MKTKTWLLAAGLALAAIALPLGTLAPAREAAATYCMPASAPQCCVWNNMYLHGRIISDTEGSVNATLECAL